MTYEEALHSYRIMAYMLPISVSEKVVEALEKVEQLEEENKEMKSTLNKFCAEFMCRECTFLDKENKQCTIAKLLL